MLVLFAPLILPLLPPLEVIAGEEDEEDKEGEEEEEGEIFLDLEEDWLSAVICNPEGADTVDDESRRFPPRSGAELDCLVLSLVFGLGRAFGDLLGQKNGTERRVWRFMGRAEWKTDDPS